MVTTAEVHSLALSLPGTEAKPHFHKTAYWAGKKIFATLDEDKQLLMVKLSAVDQSVFCDTAPAIIYPVPGGWGRAGATFIDLKKVKKTVFREALTRAYSGNRKPEKRKN